MEKTARTPTLDERIIEINTKFLEDSPDRRQAYDELFGKMLDMPELFDTEVIVLPSALRIVAVSSNALLVNRELIKESAWPVIEVFRTEAVYRDRNSLRRAAWPEEFTRSGGRVTMVRHIEMLGRCRVIHAPEDALQHNAKRVAVMITEEPVRIFIDTPAQAAKCGKDPVETEARNPQTGRRFGC